MVRARSQACQVGHIVNVNGTLASVLIGLGSSSILDHFGLTGNSVDLISAALRARVSGSITKLPCSLSLNNSTNGAVHTVTGLNYSIKFVNGIKRSAANSFFIRTLRGLNIRPIVFQNARHSNGYISLVSPSNRHAVIARLNTTLRLATRRVRTSVFSRCSYLCIRNCLIRGRSLVLGTTGATGRYKLGITISLTDFGVITRGLRFLHNLIHSCISVIFTGRSRTGAFAYRTRPLGTLRMVSRVYRLTIIGVNVGNTVVGRNSRIIRMNVVTTTGHISAANTNSFCTTKFLSKLYSKLSLHRYNAVKTVATNGIVRIINAAFNRRT